MAVHFCTDQGVEVPAASSDIATPVRSQIRPNSDFCLLTLNVCMNLA